MNTPEQYARLPKWAQLRIATLERDVEWWKGKATAGPENSDTFVKHGLDKKQPLGDSPRIEFKLGEMWHETIEAHLIDDKLRISTAGGEGILVVPSASNSVYIRIATR